MDKLAVNHIVTARTLKPLFGSAYTELGPLGFIEVLPRINRGELHKYKILKALPVKEEFNKLVAERYMSEPECVIEDVFSVIEELAEEMSSWYDSLPENLQGGDKASEIEEAQSTLEGLCQPDVPEVLQSLKFPCIPEFDASASRSGRASSAAHLLRQLAEGCSAAFPDDQDVSSFVYEVEQVVDELEGISFPGMY